MFGRIRSSFSNWLQIGTHKSPLAWRGPALRRSTNRVSIQTSSRISPPICHSVRSGAHGSDARYLLPRSWARPRCGMRPRCYPGRRSGRWTSGRCWSSRRARCWRYCRCRCWRRSPRWHGESIDFVVSADIEAAPSRNSRGVIRVCAGHQFACAATGINDGTAISIVTVQSLVAAGANRPYNRVIRAIGRGNEGRAATVLARVPGGRDRWRISCIDAEGRKRVAVRTKNDTSALVSPVGGRCLDNRAVGHMQRSYRRADAAEIAAIKQICVAVFTQCNYEAGRCCPRHIHQQWTRTTEIGVGPVELDPIDRCPVIGGRSAKNCAWLKSNHCFAATPFGGVKSITSSNERIGAVTSHAANSPYPATDCTRGPSRHSRGIVYWHADYPTVIGPAINRVATILHIKNVACEPKCSAFVLHV